MTERLNAKVVREFLLTNEKDPQWLADQLKISLRGAYDLLAGKMSNRTMTMLRLARLMGCAIEDLLIPTKPKLSA